TRSFFGTQPRSTQVPPTWTCSATAALAPAFAARRAARTPPEPAPMTKRSYSYILLPFAPAWVRRFPRPRDARRSCRAGRRSVRHLHIGGQPAFVSLAQIVERCALALA